MNDISNMPGDNDDGAAGILSQDDYRLTGAQTFIVRAASGDATYRIDLWVPDAPPPDAGWPIIYLLDAGGCFATCVEAQRRMSRRPDATGVRPAVVVGIASADHLYDVPRRQRDFTSAREGDAAGEAGAPAFLHFIETQVKPLVAARAPVDANRQSLFGHSLAGYFTLWVLANHAAAFRNYAAISPSTWWDRDALHAGLGALTLRDRRALICMGEWEDALPPWQRAEPGSADVMARRAKRNMVEGARAAAETLRSVLGEEQVAFHLLAAEDHASIVSAAIPRLLRMASLPG